MTDRVHIPQEDLALYAMQSLSNEETAAVRQHLDECAECRAEVAKLSGDLALVALSVEQHPVPEGARQRFIDKVTADAAANPDAHLAAKAGVVSIDSGRSESKTYSSISWAAVAALIIFSLALFMKMGAMKQELNQQSALIARQAAAGSRAQEVLDVLTAHSAQRALLISSKTHAEPTGRAVYLADSGGLIFQGNNLDALPANKTYELWVIPANGKAPIPAGLFRPDAAGNASVVLPPLPKGVPAKAFGVTIEKAEGSETPTAPIILAGAAAVSGE
jgi:anti-sigma-K factor RskA